MSPIDPRRIDLVREFRARPAMDSENGVARLTTSVLRRLLDPAPFPTPPGS